MCLMWKKHDISSQTLAAPTCTAVASASAYKDNSERPAPAAGLPRLAAISKEERGEADRRGRVGAGVPSAAQG